MPHQTRQVSPDDNNPIPACPLFINDLFDTLESLKTTCREYAIRATFEFKTLRSTTTRYEITLTLKKMKMITMISFLQQFVVNLEDRQMLGKRLQKEETKMPRKKASKFEHFDVLCVMNWDIQREHVRILLIREI